MMFVKYLPYLWVNSFNLCSNRFHFSFCIHYIIFIQEGNPEKRNLDDKLALAEKIAKKAAMKKEEEDMALKATLRKSSAKKKGSKKEDVSLDDLLNAGLKKTKTKWVMREKFYEIVR